MTESEPTFSALTDDEHEAFTMLCDSVWWDRVAHRLRREPPDVRPLLIRVNYQGEERAVIGVAGLDDDGMFLVHPLALLLNRAEITAMQPPGNPDLIG